MRYGIVAAAAHPDHTVTIAWSDGMCSVVDFVPYIARGELFRALQDPDYFVKEMNILPGGIGLAWPNEMDFSADGLRRDSHQEEDTGTAAPGRAPAARATGRSP